MEIVTTAGFLILITLMVLAIGLISIGFQIKDIMDYLNIWHSVELCPDLSLVRKKISYHQQDCSPDLNVSGIWQWTKRGFDGLQQYRICHVEQRNFFPLICLQLHGISLNDVPFVLSSWKWWSLTKEDIKLPGSPEALVQAEDKIRVTSATTTHHLATLTKIWGR